MATVEVGLMAFILAMIRTPRERLAKADVAKLAARYEIPVEMARFYLGAWV